MDDGQHSIEMVDEATGPRLIVKARLKEDGDVGGRLKGKIIY